MDSDNYSVVLQYDPENIETHEKVVACLLRIAPASARKMEKIRSNGRLIVKRQTDISTAKRLVSILRETGAACRVTKLPSSLHQRGATDEDSRQDRLSEPEDKSIPSLISCPSCGFISSFKQHAVATIHRNDRWPAFCK